MAGTIAAMTISRATQYAARARARLHGFLSRDMRPYEVEKGSCVEGLAEIAAGSRACLQLVGRDLGERRDENDRRHSPLGAQAVLQLEATQSTELHVQHHAARLPGAD